jgi:hypothetical protein
MARRRLPPWWFVASGPQVEVDPAAVELELVDLALAVVLAASLERENLQVARQPMELGQQVSYRHPLTVAHQTLYVVSSAAPASSIGPTGNRAPHRAWPACAVGAPPTVEPRTPRTPSKGGARRGAR